MPDFDIHYARSGDVNLAHTTVGEGPVDVVFVSGWILSNLEVAREGTPAQFYEGMAASSRLILFDKRGTGLSDRVTGVPDLQTRIDDVRAVMDAVGTPRAAILGFSEGGLRHWRALPRPRPTMRTSDGDGGDGFVSAPVPERSRSSAA